MSAGSRAFRLIRFSLFFPVILLFLHFSEPARAGKPSLEEAGRHIGQAQQLMQEGKWKEAAKEFRAALKSGLETPEHYSSVYVALGICERQYGDDAAAEKDFRAALDKNPEGAIPHYNLGSLYIDKHEFQKAVDEDLAAIRLKPGFADAYNHLGLAYVELGKLDDAAEAFRNAVKYRPDFQVAADNLNKVLASQGKAAEAKQESAAGPAPPPVPETRKPEPPAEVAAAKPPEEAAPKEAAPDPSCPSKLHLEVLGIDVDLSEPTDRDFGGRQIATCKWVSQVNSESESKFDILFRRVPDLPPMAVALHPSNSNCDGLFEQLQRDMLGMIVQHSGLPYHISSRVLFRSSTNQSVCRDLAIDKSMVIGIVSTATVDLDRDATLRDMLERLDDATSDL